MVLDEASNQEDDDPREACTSTRGRGRKSTSGHAAGWKEIDEVDQKVYDKADQVSIAGDGAGDCKDNVNRRLTVGPEETMRFRTCSSRRRSCAVRCRRRYFRHGFD